MAKLQTVVETRAYLRATDGAGLAADDRDEVVAMVAARPDSGDVMAGAGGMRKVRVRKPGRGKSGGYRVITLFSGPDVPLFLITLFAKGEKDNLTKAERNALAKGAKQLIDSYGKRGMP